MKVLEVFKVAEPASSGEPRSGPFWMPNMIACTTHDSPALLPRQSRLLTEEPDIMFIITRSKNSNTIAYRRILDKKGQNEVEGFWQRLDDIKDESVTALEALRADLTWIERKMAYGVSTDKKAGTVSIVPVPSLKLQLVQDAGNFWRVQTTLDGRLCYLVRIYVSASDTSYLPTVHFVNIHGVDVATGQEVVVKIR